MNSKIINKMKAHLALFGLLIFFSTTALAIELGPDTGNLCTVYVTAEQAANGLRYIDLNSLFSKRIVLVFLRDQVEVPANKPSLNFSASKIDYVAGPIGFFSVFGYQVQTSLTSTNEVGTMVLYRDSAKSVGRKSFELKPNNQDFNRKLQEAFNKSIRGLSCSKKN